VGNLEFLSFSTPEPEIEMLQYLLCGIIVNCRFVHTMIQGSMGKM